MKKTFYMVGNAHLDPVWQWRWQEGSAEAKATIRSALDRMKENKDFIFVCSSVSVYQWIEEFDPDMFEEIRVRVKEGRFVPIGGGYVQPDCNLPSGEGFARQSLYAQRWFYEKFGVTAKIGYNVDSFGHTLLPQILRKSGLEAYVFMRPNSKEGVLPYNLFSWVSPDGTAIPTYRIPEAYCKNFFEIEMLEESLEIASNYAPDDLDFAFRFYGVGNHGGGPTKRNIELIKEYQKQHPEMNFLFSNVKDLFDRIKNDGMILPEWYEDLQHHAPGCYSACTEIKNAIRRCETELCAAESYAVLGGVLCKKDYPKGDLNKAWQDTLFLHFHDIAGGCAIRDAYEDAAMFSGEARVIAARVTNNSLQTISWKIDTSDDSKGVPIIVFNPHPWQFEGIVEFNAQANMVADSEGNQIPFQRVRSQKHSCWRLDNTIFKASLPPMGYNTYYMTSDKPYSGIPRPECQSNVFAYMENENNPYNSFFENAVLENECFRVRFDNHTGFVSSLFDKEKEKEWFLNKGAIPAVMQYKDDVWGHGMVECHTLLGYFAEPKVSIIESGPLRATVLVESRYNNSTLKQYFSLTTGEKILKVQAVLDWREKHMMLKMQFPVALTNPKAFYEIPFGVIERSCNGEEEPGQRWVAMSGDEGRLALINDNKYSFSFVDNTMEMTVLHSSIYCDHGGARDSESEYMEQGIHRFSYSVMPLDDDGWSSVIRAARELNIKPENIIENNHKGSLDRQYFGLSCSAKNVMISALKRSEDGSGLVLRAYETDGCSGTVATFSGGLLSVPLTSEFSPYEIKTFINIDNTNIWKEVLLTEFDM